MKTTAIVLAAGQGTRMKSSKSKVLHEVATVPMVEIVLNKVKHFDNIILVLSPRNKDEVEQTIDLANLYPKVKIAIQEEQLGTAHSVQAGVDELKKIDIEFLNNESNKVVVLYGDSPLITSEIITNLTKKDNDLTVLGFDKLEDNAYGKLVFKGDKLERIVEDKDATELEKNIVTCNSGFMAMNCKVVNNCLYEIKNNNAQQEFYLTDLVEIANKKQYDVGYIVIKDEDSVLGVNNQAELRKVRKIMNEKLIEQATGQGIEIGQDVYLSYFTSFEVDAKDITIEDSVKFYGRVNISAGTHIKPFCAIEAGRKISQEITFESNTTVGPFARIRPSSLLKEGSKVGNFCEVKKSAIGRGSKVNHLSYIGDSDIGDNVNIGAGTITCNYDGYNKFKTQIDDEVFVGSNTVLIAPVRVKKGAITGAGSVITNDVEENSIAISRPEQKNIQGGAVRFRKKAKTE